MSSSDRSCSLNNSESSLTSLCVDISPSSSNFFEVLYVGKIKVCRNSVVANTFIDDALEKFRLYELEKKKLNNKELIGTIGRLKSEDNVIFLEKTDTNKSSNIPHHSQLAQRSTSSFNINNHQISDNNNVDDPNTISELTELKSSLINVDNNQQQQQNRTMLLQVDRADLRLISPDRKGILLHKHQKDMINCIQGITAPDYFGFICKEINNAYEFYFVGYIFKCESASIAADAVAALSQSSSPSSTSSLFAESNNKIPSNSCEHCPILWYNKLNDEIDEHPNLSDRKIQSVILKRLDQLDPEEQMLILTKFREADSECSIKEQNEFLMKLLRAHCNNKQIRHIHDTAENRSEFLNQYLGVGGKNVFSKAKKSISNSFDHFLKKRTSSSTSPNNARQTSLPFSSGNNNLNKELSPSLTQIPTTSTADDSEDSENNNKFSSRSSPHLLLLTDESQSEINNSYAVVNSDNRTLPISDRGSKMDIFLKVGHNNNANSISKSSAESSGSWRQAILKKVITPKEADDSAASSIISNRKRNNAELRELWKKAIKQAILLVRMDKENRRLKLEQVESAVKRVKLDYDEMKLNQRSEVMDVWEMITNKDLHVKCDKSMLLQAIRQGVPRNKRGDVWFSLAEQHCTNSAPPDPQKYPNYNTPYEQLLRQLTSHQHAILIDLGRTFPQHSYFVSPMGPGQLALFNLLKAYSLLDPEVGYCQGLSFVAGILLLHMDEAEAFILLRHLMFRRGLRTQYLPDMIGLQIKLYQLSRLVHDQLPDLYRHLEIAEVVPSLYAAPWILTLFASQFPLGFAARVFDLVFLEGAEVIFKIALALLSFHKDEILKCENFEDIMEYFKETISSVDKVTLEKLMKLIYTHHTTDISKLLDEYKVEYQVLQEEMESVQPKLDRLRNIERDHKLLMEKNKVLLAQLEFSQTNVQRLEKTRVLQQAQLNRTEMQSRGLDVTVATLGNFIQNLIEQKVDIEIPDEVRRILSQITALERNKQETETNKMQKNNNLLRMLQEKNKEQINRISTPQENKTMLKSLSTGKIILPTTLQESVTRTNSLNSKNLQDNNILIPQLKNQYAEKKSQFFSNSHNSILEKQKFHNSQNSSINSIIDIDIQDYDDDNNNKSNNEETFAAIEMLKKEASSSTSTATDGNHPFSNCGDVQFTFSGTKELKHFKSLNKTTR